MRAYPIGTRINSVRNDDAALLEAAGEVGLFFSAERATMPAADAHGHCGQRGVIQ